MWSFSLAHLHIRAVPITVNGNSIIINHTRINWTKLRIKIWKWWSIAQFQWATFLSCVSSLWAMISQHTANTFAFSDPTETSGNLILVQFFGSGFLFFLMMIQRDSHARKHRKCQRWIHLVLRPPRPWISAKDPTEGKERASLCFLEFRVLFLLIPGLFPPLTWEHQGVKEMRNHESTLGGDSEETGGPTQAGKMWVGSMYLPVQFCHSSTSPPSLSLSLIPHSSALRSLPHRATSDDPIPTCPPRGKTPEVIPGLLVSSP